MCRCVNVLNEVNKWMHVHVDILESGCFIMRLSDL